MFEFMIESNFQSKLPYPILWREEEEKTRKTTRLSQQEISTQKIYVSQCLAASKVAAQLASVMARRLKVNGLLMTAWSSNCLIENEGAKMKSSNNYNFEQESKKEIEND